MCLQSTPRHQTYIMMKTCTMTSHVRHSERGSVISDCLVMIICLFDFVIT